MPRHGSSSRRRGAGGFSTAGRPGEAITQPVAIDPPPKILAPLPISSPRKRKILIHPFSFPHYPPMNQSARPQSDKSIYSKSLYLRPPPPTRTRTRTRTRHDGQQSAVVEYKSSPAPLLPGFCPHLPSPFSPAARDSSIQSTRHSTGGRGTAAEE